MKTVFVIDIDTSISNNTERAKLLKKQCRLCLGSIDIPKVEAVCPTCGHDGYSISQASWDLFLSPEEIGKDVPVKKAQDAIYRMRELGIEFHFITGRSYKLRDVTAQWLKTHFSWDETSEGLYMRGKEHEGLAASVYKELALKKLIEDRKLDKAAFIFMEDDPYVFRMYQQYGIVIKCPEGWDYWMPEGAHGFEPSWKE